MASDKPATEQAVVGPWAALAVHWNRIACPLRPVPEDISRLQSVWLASLPAGLPSRPIDVLLLGVTPEFALFPWAPSMNLTAVDSSEAMLKAVWPGNGPERRALQGDWLQLPFRPDSIDLILCDNGPTLFNGLAQLTRFSRELRRVLRPEGRAVMRNFARPPLSESIDSVVAEVATGRARNFHAFKMRFLMALQGSDSATGVNLGAAWDRFNALFPDRTALVTLLDCSLEAVSTIDAYRGRDASYSFYSLPEMAQGFPGFRFSTGPAGHYPFAECCPVFCLSPEP